MSYMPKITVNNRTFDVVLTDALMLQVTIDKGETIFAETVDQLRRKISHALKQASAEYAIPVILAREDEPPLRYVRAILRGAHARTGEYLFTIDGAKVRLAAPQILTTGDRLTDEQIAEINAICEEVHLANAKLRNHFRKTLNTARPSVHASQLLRRAEDASNNTESSVP